MAKCSCPLCESMTPTFEIELQRLLNKHSIDNRLGVPDYELAKMLMQHLAGLAKVRWRETKENI